MKGSRFLALWLVMATLFSGCTIAPKLFSDSRDPLRESTLAGTGGPKILLVSISGTISTSPEKGLLRSRPSLVQEVVAQLRKAEKDPDIKAVVLRINSPGGTVTASDILYHELLAYKERTGVKLVAVMLDLAASGGYYVALPCDRIIAHPTTITGSIGVIFMRPELSGLMSKVGVQVAVNKSGEKKDMASYFRPATAEETRMLQELTEQLGKRFTRLVKTHRNIPEDIMTDIASARVYLADEALERGLVDRIGYFQDALEEARLMADMPEEYRLVTYRRAYLPDDNVYHSAAGGATSIGTGMLTPLPDLKSGFFYLWLPGRNP
jgi:protease-4